MGVLKSLKFIGRKFIKKFFGNFLKFLKKFSSRFYGGKEKFAKIVPLLNQSL